jgi:nitrite reductase/ring-hydroxylating ferredoxin subunit
MTDSQVDTEGASTTRRAMLAGVGAIGASALLTACGTDEGDGSLADEGSAPDSNGGAAPTTGAPTTGAPDSGGASGTKLSATSEIPQDGGKIFEDKQVVVTQPAAGEFKCFTAICPHQQCTVTNIRNGNITCACHGSQFSIEDGSVKKGPATSGLDEVTINVDGEAIYLNA